jgi:hypothetical protein
MAYNLSQKFAILLIRSISVGELRCGSCIELINFNASITVSHITSPTTGPLLVEHLTMAYAFAEQFKGAPEDILVQKRLWSFVNSIQSGLSTNNDEEKSQGGSCVERKGKGKEKGKGEEKECSFVRRCILLSTLNRNCTDNADGDDDEEEEHEEEDGEDGGYDAMGSDHRTERKSPSASPSTYHNHNTGSNSNRSKDDEDPTIAQWSYHTQCVMACIAVISHLYSDAINNKSNADIITMNKKCPKNLRTLCSTKSKWYETSLIFFLIIARLPQNVHAISRVRTVSTVRSTLSDSTTSKNKNKEISKRCMKNKVNYENEESNENNERGEKEDEIIQERAGFGLFLCASAVNHSCAPNCTVRFEFDSSSNLTTTVTDHVKSKNDSNMETMESNAKIPWERMTDMNNEELKNNLNLIENVRLELVCTQYVAKNTQCYISYGPLASRQAKKARKVFLKEQYLFDCTCSACRIEKIKNAFSEKWWYE